MGGKFAYEGTSGQCSALATKQVVSLGVDHVSGGRINGDSNVHLNFDSFFGPEDSGSSEDSEGDSEEASSGGFEDIGEGVPSKEDGDGRNDEPVVLSSGAPAPPGEGKLASSLPNGDALGGKNLRGDSSGFFGFTNRGGRGGRGAGRSTHRRPSRSFSRRPAPRNPTARWADLLTEKGGPEGSDKTLLHCQNARVEGMKVVDFGCDDVKDALARWDNVVMGFVIGANPVGRGLPGYLRRL